MPHSERVTGAIVEVSELLAQIGYETRDIVGPVDAQGEEIPQNELEAGDADARYYLIGRADGANFYIMFELDRNYGLIVYPMDVLRHLGSYLDEDEVERILDESIEWDGVDTEIEDQLYRTAARSVVENTDPERFNRAAFDLSAYASTAVVDYYQTTTENGFPVEFQCARGIFPYTEQLSIERVDDRVHPVRIAGERGRRYVEYSFRIDKEEKDPEEYEFRHLI